MNQDSEAGENTDREIWRRVEEDYYSPSIHVNAAGSIGINVGGIVYVLPVERWHELARAASPAAVGDNQITEVFDRAIDPVGEHGNNATIPCAGGVASTTSDPLPQQAAEPVMGEDEAVEIVDAWFKKNYPHSKSGSPSVRHVYRALKSEAKQPVREGDAEIKRLRNFVESITIYGGPYPYLSGTTVLADAYEVLSQQKKHGE